MKKHIITIAGKPGSGKSSTANLVAEKLGYSRYSSGDFMRAIAERHGVTLNEISNMAESDPSIDHEIDDENRKMNDKSDVVVDARLAFHFVPKSFKVYLDLDVATSAERIFRDKTDARHKSGEATASTKELEELLSHRLDSERKRYMELYGVDHTDSSQFDLVIDTGHHPLHEVVATILDEYKKWLAK